MRNTLSHRRVLVILAVLAGIGCFVPVQGSGALARFLGGIVRLADHGVDLVLAPTTGWLKRGADALRPGEQRALLPAIGSDRLMIHYQQALAFNERLLIENARLHEEILHLRQSRDMLGSRRVTLQPALVTAYGADRRYPTLTLDRGAASGVGVGMAVEYRSSLVGEVIDVGRRTSTVRLLTSHRRQLLVRIMPVDPEVERYELDEKIELARDGASFVVRLPQGTPVRVGDVARLADDRWSSHAQGLLVGRVEEVTDDPADPLSFRQATVRPTVPLPSLRQVSVMIPPEAAGGASQDSGSGAR